MGFLDWLALATLLSTLVGAQVSADPNLELERSTPGQSVRAMAANAEVRMGGSPIMRFADSGAATAMERAVDAKEHLKQVIHQKELPGSYMGIGLRLGGDDKLATINYFDVRITDVTQSDAQANHAGNAKELAESWKTAVDREIHRLPAALPENWITAAGKPTPSLLVSNPTLTAAVSDCLPEELGQRVTVTADGGTIVLEGSVQDDRERGRIVRMVKQVPGVVEVIDHTSVQR